MSISKSERKVMLVFPSSDHRFKDWTGVPGLFLYRVYRAPCGICTSGYGASTEVLCSWFSWALSIVWGGLELLVGFPAEPPVESASAFYKSSAGACARQ